MRYVMGIDEAGRGPLAGPVAVGIVVVPKGFDVTKEFPGVADSKKLSEKNRENIFEMLERRTEQGEVRYAVEFENSGVIDDVGIVTAVRRALFRGVNALAPNPALVHIQLDGALRAPSEYSQETIIDGDELIPIISLASIAAKVSRDRLMVELSKKYKSYGFEKHKGYGTKMHYEMLKKYGPCVIHRRSFLHIATLLKYATISREINI